MVTTISDTARLTMQKKLGALIRQKLMKKCTFLGYERFLPLFPFKEAILLDEAE